jgi:hypothetical protein
MAQRIDASFRQGLASLTWRNADRYAASPTTTSARSLMLAVTVGASLLVTWVATKGLFFFLQEAPIP